MSEDEIRHAARILADDCASGRKGDEEITAWARAIVEKNSPDDLAGLMALLLLRIKFDAREMLRLRCPYSACEHDQTCEHDQK